ncbi:hypothetical protein Pmani_014090 [Petrolisthes manimaculis]|uniref:Uncharacterized protein n=1 Tax=Petrolisthes manimaculis TaxID=1843537 RepID=A0AAE1PWA4_9EUCA|nr:hypothetical protein Pmani_014090 [Petrolisthes manimaculis]
MSDNTTQEKEEETIYDNEQEEEVTLEDDDDNEEEEEESIDNRIVVPANQYYSTLEKLKDDLIKENQEVYSSIVDKYTCLAHGLTPSPSKSRKDNRSFNNYLENNKPDKKLRVSLWSPSIGSLCGVQPNASVGTIQDDDIEKEVESVLQKRKAKLGLLPEYELKTIDSPCVSFEKIKSQEDQIHVRTTRSGRQLRNAHQETITSCHSKKFISGTNIKDITGTQGKPLTLPLQTSHRKKGRPRKTETDVRQNIMVKKCDLSDEEETEEIIDVKRRDRKAIKKSPVCAKKILTGDRVSGPMQGSQSDHISSEADHCLEEVSEIQERRQIPVNKENGNAKYVTKKKQMKKQPSNQRNIRQTMTQEIKQPVDSVKKDEKPRLRSVHTKSHFKIQFSSEEETDTDSTQEEEAKSPDKARLRHNIIKRPQRYASKEKVPKCTSSVKKMRSKIKEKEKSRGSDTQTVDQIKSKRKKTSVGHKRNRPPEDQCHNVLRTEPEDDVLIFPTPTRKTVCDKESPNVQDDPCAKRNKREDVIAPSGVSNKSRFDRITCLPKPSKTNLTTTTTTPDEPEEEEEFHRLELGSHHHTPSRSSIRNCVGSQVLDSQSQVERSQTSQLCTSSVVTSIKVRSFWELDSDDDGVGDDVVQSLSRDPKNTTEDVTAISESISSHCPDTSTSSIPSYRELGPEKWLAAIKAMRNNEKSVKTSFTSKKSSSLRRKV